MRSKSVCFSGHRKIPDNEYMNIYDRLLGTVKALAEEGYTEFYAGGAVGFDMMAEMAVLQIKKEYNIKLHLVLPYRGHSSYWSASDRNCFEKILMRADSEVYMYDRYNKWSFAVRNRRMVDLSSVLVYYMTEEKGGTWGTVKYASVQDLKLIGVD